MDKRDNLRQAIRSHRQQLPATQREDAAKAACALLSTQDVFHLSHEIGCYLANAGELDPAHIVQHIWQQEKQTYLPVVKGANSDGHLAFAHYHPATRLVKNRFNIPEPVMQPAITLEPSALDLVLMPLVAFDLEGNRLGMGAGYYDRSFAFRLASNTHKPKLYGLAYEFQKVDRLDVESWDVPLDAVITEKTVYHFA